jgi:hypothetical protein
LALPYQLRKRVDEWLRKNDQQRWGQAWFAAAPERYYQYVRVLACALGSQALLDEEKEEGHDLVKRMVKPFVPPVLKKVCIADVPEMLQKVVATHFLETVRRIKE